MRPVAARAPGAAAGLLAHRPRRGQVLQAGRDLRLLLRAGAQSDTLPLWQSRCAAWATMMMDRLLLVLAGTAAPLLGLGEQLQPLSRPTPSDEYRRPLAAPRRAELSDVAGSTQRPCDILASAGTPCVAAHSSTRALYLAYAGPLYQLIKKGSVSSSTTKDIKVLGPGGVVDAAAHEAFCGPTGACTVLRIYDQSPNGNHLGIQHGTPNLESPRNGTDRGVR